MQSTLFFLLIGTAALSLVFLGLITSLIVLKSKNSDAFSEMSNSGYTIRDDSEMFRKKA